MPRSKGFEFRVFGLRFRLTLVPTLTTIPALLVLLALGTWQVHRLHWKVALITERTERVTAPPVALPEAGADIAALEFRHVRASGHFLHDRELYMPARELKSGELGFQIFTPLIGEDGAVTLIDRGFVPLNKKDPATRQAGQVEGPVTVEGLIRRDGRRSRFTPDNVPEKNFWFYADIPAMARHAGLTNVRPYYVEADATPNPGGLPLGGQARIVLPNDHLQYAITWYSLAIALVVIYFVYHHVPDA
ncbi:MAG: SURF1 family protein [Alphaproteobacteria bacterium]